ncbi:MAG: hypothetical protein ABIQ16_05220 [Polyangiaceae bacterium]
MRSSFVISLIGATSMALALLVGCGDDDAKPVSSQVGQSCVRTADCAEGLNCIANTCYKAGTSTAGAGGGTAGPTPPVLGGEGESCTSRLDCKTDLGCFNNRCTASEPTGDAGSSGMTTPGVMLGSRGESCTVNSDCSKGLVCVPIANVGAGVCDLADFGIKPTGMTCSGECTADADCYQLPLQLHTASIKSCEDVDAAITLQALDCAADPVAPGAKLLCFEQATYCGYVKKTSKVWTCDTDVHACVYKVACDPLMGADAPDGCPTYSRLNALVGLTCNADTLRCVGAKAAAGCTTDAKCEGVQVVDSTLGDVCEAGECTCYAGNKQCYRKCGRDIDCAGGQVCDTAMTKLCIPDAECDTDAQCAIANHSLAYKCNAGTCGQACANDHDCSGTGQATAFNGRVCSAGFCTSVAADCAEDGKQCAPTTPGALKPFCVTTSMASGSTVSSSVTN